MKIFKKLKKNPGIYSRNQISAKSKHFWALQAAPKFMGHTDTQTDTQTDT